MACASSHSIISTSSCRSFTSRRVPKRPSWVKGSTKLFSVNASSSSSSTPEDPDCNVEECAPDKEVGKVSMEWLAGEKTKVTGTYPPKKKGWTGYVEKDTAGQTNIYSVEPQVYVAQSAISSGAAGTSADGAENTAAIAAGLALIAIASASSILIQVSKKAPEVQKTPEYSGPPLSYYINKFKPAAIVEALVAPEPQSTSAEQVSVPSEPQIPSDVQSAVEATVIPEVQVEMEEQVETFLKSLSSVS